MAVARECQNSVALLLCYGAVSSLELGNRVRIQPQFIVQRQRRQQRELQKKKQSPGLKQRNKVFHVHHSSLYIFFYKLLYFILNFVVDVNTRQLFPNSFFFNLQYSHLEFSFRKRSPAFDKLNNIL